ncbi:REDY-like protein HapK [Sphingomonas sp.]|uniref:REDY-like protein HapK n=1 Tax=Sphingomonas sp. TaxID=28214 RepID=UPI002DBDAEEB|nr:REDY-like protein HapK [Sphingomonas sp.]HEU4970207.1 REDY-like protein HapK [Sphingomonas sp.]
MRIIALFNLSQTASREDYEAWARSRDLPTVNGLSSVESFQVLRTTGVLFSGNKPPYDYVEILDVTGLDAFLADCGGDAVGALAREMSAFTDGATFITTEAL